MSARPNTNAAWFHPPWWPTNRGGSRPPQRSTKAANCQRRKRGSAESKAVRRPISAGFDSWPQRVHGNRRGRPDVDLPDETQTTRQRLRSQAISPAWTFRVTSTLSDVMASSRPRLSVVSHTEPLTTYDDAASVSVVSAALDARESCHATWPASPTSRTPIARFAARTAAHEPEKRRTDGHRDVIAGCHRGVVVHDVHRWKLGGHGRDDGPMVVDLVEGVVRREHAARESTEAPERAREAAPRT